MTCPFDCAGGYCDNQASPAAPPSERPFGLNDVAPHSCPLPAGWCCVISGYRHDPSRVIDPSEVTDKPDRLPDEWADKYWPTSHEYTPTASPPGRLGRDLARATDIIVDALRTAGWNTSDINVLLRYADLPREIERLGEAAWSFRRFGFSAYSTTQWKPLVPIPAVARLYADLGYKPRSAARAIAWAERNFPPEWRATAQGILICYDTTRTRTSDYVRAGIRHEEVHYWEHQRTRLDEAGKADFDETLAVMAALNTSVS